MESPNGFSPAFSSGRPSFCPSAGQARDTETVDLTLHAQQAARFGVGAYLSCQIAVSSPFPPPSPRGIKARGGSPPGKQARPPLLLGSLSFARCHFSRRIHPVGTESRAPAACRAASPLWLQPDLRGRVKALPRVLRSLCREACPLLQAPGRREEGPDGILLEQGCNLPLQPLSGREGRASLTLPPSRRALGAPAEMSTAPSSGAWEPPDVGV